jgi:putative phage-type endonuclease
MIHEVEQGSPEWHELRSTRFTASNFYKMFLKENTKTYQNFINEVVFARLTGEVEEGYTNDFMRRGIEVEPQAIEQYELDSFNKVHRVGFISYSDWIGCSPDGLIGTDGMIQIKCPKATTLMEYYGGEVPNDYYIQMQGELFVTGRAWSIFYVYHPKLKPYEIKVDRDEEMISQIHEKLSECIKEAKRRIDKLK